MPWPRPSTASAVAFCGELVTKSPQKATAEAVEGAPTGRTERRQDAATTNPSPSCCAQVADEDFELVMSCRDANLSYLVCI